MGAQTIFAIFRNQCKWTPNYSKRLKFLPIWLAPLWPRITLIEQAGNMLYESLFNERKALESPRRDTTCASMGKFEKIGPKSRSERCFLMIFWRFSNVVPEASRTISVKIFHVFWCPEALGSFLGWSWIDSGNFIFSWIFFKKWSSSDSWSRYDRVITAHAEKSPNLRHRRKFLFQFCFVIFSKSNRWNLMILKIVKEN